MLGRVLLRARTERVRDSLAIARGRIGILTAWPIARIQLGDEHGMTRNLLLVGTSKGAFILDGDASRTFVVPARPALQGLADP